MKLGRKIVTCVLLLCFSLSSSGCATYHLGRLPSPYLADYPSPVAKNNVSVAVKIMSCSEALAAFDCEMGKRMITPVFIVIENKSERTYAFRKADVDASYAPAEEVAKKCARSTMGRLVTYGVFGILPITWLIFLPMFISEAINCPTLNSRMRSDYTTNEIADATIGPGRSLSGVMFVSPLKSGELFTVPLVDKATGERVLFQFQNSQLGSVCAAPEESKPETEARTKETTGSEPTTNFGPK